MLLLLQGSEPELHVVDLSKILLRPESGEYFSLSKVGQFVEARGGIDENRDDSSLDAGEAAMRSGAFANGVVQGGGNIAFAEPPPEVEGRENGLYPRLDVHGTFRPRVRALVSAPAALMETPQIFVAIHPHST